MYNLVLTNFVIIKLEKNMFKYILLLFFMLLTFNTFANNYISGSGKNY